MTAKVAPSLLSADFSCLRDEIKRIEKHGAQWVHLDIMDGHFVPSITIGPLVVKALRPHTELFMDAHLMVADPEKQVKPFVEAGVDLLTVQYEATAHLDRVLRIIKAAGIKAGVALNPATPPGVLDYIWPLLDLVLVMSVNPGAGGQQFIPAVLPKIEALAREIKARDLSTVVQVDGGINRQNAREIIAAGATVLVAGSAVFKADRGMNLMREISTFARET